VECPRGSELVFECKGWKMQCGVEAEEGVVVAVQGGWCDMALYSLKVDVWCWYGGNGVYVPESVDEGVVVFVRVEPDFVCTCGVGNEVGIMEIRGYGYVERGGDWRSVRGNDV